MIHKRIATRLMAAAALALLLSGPSIAAEGAAAAGPLASIESLDVPRYMGRWYEIAGYPNWFQKKCIGYTSAEYTLKPDGEVMVVNRCRLENGETSEAVGAARQIGGANSPKLEVRFAPAWLSFIPALWGDYWVIDIDANYQLVAVSEPKREYLWILSRTPHVAPDVLDAMLQRLRAKGFDTRKLQMFPQ